MTDQGDYRGAAYFPGQSWADFLGGACHMHIVAIRPGCVRGNHYHAVQKEVLVVLFEDQWLLRWDNGPDSPASERHFSGAGMAMLEIDPLAAHAVHNCGQKDLKLVSLCDRVYDLQAPDTVVKTLLEAGN
jgi:dTDP-4-dehydrorhamnose 3,5-epimerase-like enzyme